jgi:hypothetical protein
MPFRKFRVFMQMTDPSARRTRAFEKEGFQIFVYFDHIMLITGRYTNDIAYSNDVFLIFTHDFCSAFEDDPVFFKIVVMSIKAAITRHLENTRAGDIAPFGSIT